ncbi:MAG: NUDIX domain-containing protein [Candidatus Paceibacterota bacterium]|jgi:8-oxo-dGTP pyrophosphatase MutT (NUDIX family)
MPQKGGIRATALVVKDEKILMMHRLRDGEEYYVLPGGAMEEGEEVKKAVLRELKEETNLGGVIIEDLADFSDDFCRTRIFEVEVENTDAKIREDSPEYIKQNKNNQFNLEWVPIKELIFLTIWPMQTREFLFKYFKLA